MICTQCNTEIPNGASFCPQCGNSTRSEPIFPSDVQDQQQTGSNNLLIGGLCLLGTLLILAGSFGAAWFNIWITPKTPLTPRDMPVGNIAAGEDLNLYGTTLDDKDFDWENLRGKYVVVKFTATWCPPCKMEIPGLKDIYDKYRDKEFEMVSVYMSEPEPNAAEAIKQYAATEELPWIILSEPLTLKAGLPEFGKTYAIRGFPTILIADKEGKVLKSNVYSRDQSLHTELKKLFGE